MQEFHIKILLIVKLFLDIPSVNLGQSNLKCSVLGQNFKLLKIEIGD